MEDNRKVKIAAIIQMILFTISCFIGDIGLILWVYFWMTMCALAYVWLFKPETLGFSKE